MNKIAMNMLILVVVAFLCAPNVWANDVRFFVARFDYQTLESKNLYYFTQTMRVSPPEEGESLYGGLYVKILPAGDFGSTLIRSVAAGDTVYAATTIWDGIGRHVFPPPEYEIDSRKSESKTPTPIRQDFVTYFYQNGDSARANQVLENAKQYIILEQFGDSNFGLLVYPHFFSVGAVDPITAEWIVIAYEMPELPPITKFNWQDISFNMTKSYVNVIAPHTALADSVIMGSRYGLFGLNLTEKNWYPFAFFSESNDFIEVTAIDNIANPWIMSPLPVDVIWLGTTEYSAIPEDRYGHVFVSFEDGKEWIDTEFPKIAVTAVEANPLNPRKALAAAYNEFYSEGGLYEYQDSTWTRLFFPPDISRPDYIDFRINYILHDVSDINLILLATEKGLYRSVDYGLNWEITLPNFNIIKIINPFDDGRTFYAATSGDSRSDGIYVSHDGGKSWEVLNWMTRIKGFDQTPPIASDMWIFYVAAEEQGVFVTDYAGSGWLDITGNLPDSKFTALACDSRKIHQVYVGTQTSIYKLNPQLLKVDLAVEETKVSFTPANPISTDTLEVKAQIDNLSSISVNNINILFRLDNPLSNWDTEVNTKITMLDAETSTTVSVRLPINSLWGETDLVVLVDPENSIAEEVETNNLVRLGMTISLPPDDRVWQNISKTLSDVYITDIAMHPFDEKYAFVATTQGAYRLPNIPGGLTEKLPIRILNVTQITADPHPVLDWIVPVVYVGATGFTDIPEDMSGQIWRSEDGGDSWINLEAPDLKPTAILPEPENSLNAFVGFCNSFEGNDGFGIFADSVWKIIDLTPGDSSMLKVNCISYDEKAEYPFFLGTNVGIYRGDESLTKLEHVFAFNVVAIYRAYRNENRIYAATSGQSKSDGIYFSDDGGLNWEILHWHTDIVDMAVVPQRWDMGYRIYLASNSDGVFESVDEGISWRNISKGLPERNLTCLAVDQIDWTLLYLGTDQGIYMFGPKYTAVADEESSQNLIPENFRLYPNFPNPFNQNTVIRYALPTGLESYSTEIHIFNILGQCVRRLVERTQSPGIHQISWNGTNDLGQTVDSGIYFVRMKVGEFVAERKVLLIK